MNTFELSLQKAQQSLAATNQAERHTIATAHFAFGGHISRGLLNRGRAASNRLNCAITKAGKKKIFLDISKLPNAYTRAACTTQFWEQINGILDNCKLYCDFGDKYDYWSAERGISCFDKIEALKHFIERHGNGRERKLIRTILTRNENAL